MGCDLSAEPQMEFVRKALGFFGGWTDKLSIFFFGYTGGCAKETKSFCSCFTKQQNFTQRIATVVALCYNEQRRRMSRA